MKHTFFSMVFFIIHGGYMTEAFHESQSSITKCLVRDRERIRLYCQENGHVLLNPEIVVGALEDGCQRDCRRCRRSSNTTCVGTTASVLNDLASCFWKKDCQIDFSKGEPLIPQVGETLFTPCVGRVPDYADVGISKCVDKNAINDICRQSSLTLELHPGVIRSDPSFPWGYHRQNTTCQLQILSPTPALSMYVELEVFDIEYGDQLSISWTEIDNHTHNHFFMKEGRDPGIVIVGYDVRVTWRTGRGFTTKKGFLLLYRGFQEQVFNRKGSFPGSTMNDFGKASLQITMKNFENHMHMQCPVGELIVSPTMYVGKSRQLKCSGITPTLLRMQNECYWRRSCDFQWAGPGDWTLLYARECQRGSSVVATNGYRCVGRDNIVDICNHRKTVSGTSDLVAIRSHAIYPWYYKPQGQRCQKKIKVNKGEILSFYVEKVDVSSLDTFLVQQIYHKRRYTLLSGNAKKTEFTIAKGTVHISFTVNSSGVSNKGFLLFFRRFKSNQFTAMRKKARKLKRKLRRRRRRKDRQRRKRGKKQKRKKLKRRIDEKHI